MGPAINYDDARIHHAEIDFDDLTLGALGCDRYPTDLRIFATVSQIAAAAVELNQAGNWSWCYNFKV